MAHIPIDNDFDTSDDNHPSLSNISVYNLPVYHHTGLFRDPEPAPEYEFKPTTSKLLTPVAFAIVLILVFYGFLLCLGIPQGWTKSVNAPVAVSEEYIETSEAHPCPSIVMVAPFAGLLLCIAFLPLVPATAYWWEHNINKFFVAAGLGVITLLYYGFGCHFPVEGHWPGHSTVNPAVDGGFAVVKTVLANAIMYEFVPFIVLLFALFIITGGIRISVNFKGTPLVNTVILAIGAILASFIGTTGAAMLLIRILLEINRRRKYRVHTVILFIFTVCNAGGCLTPLGDPPLFLGYLRGIPFEWTLFALWPSWLFLNVILLGFYFCWDTWFYRRESDKYKQRGMNCRMKMIIAGWGVNVPLLLGIVVSVAFLTPNKPFLGWEGYYPPYYLREAVQLGLAAISLLVGSYNIRKRNAFNFLAIGEVAALFFGIFICMQVPVQIINVEGKNMVARAEEKTGFAKETLFFWTTGSLSLVLDNAPTYVVFFETARTLSPGATEEEVIRLWREANEKIHFHEMVAKLMPGKDVNEEEMNKEWQKALDANREIRVQEIINVLRSERNDESTNQLRQEALVNLDKNEANQEKERDKRVFAEIAFPAVQALSSDISREKAEQNWKEAGKSHSYRDIKPVPVGKNGFIDHYLLIAVALGTVFMGGMTYIANGPNFMVKAIADQAGVEMPSFFGFIVYSCLILLPVIILTQLVFV